MKAAASSVATPTQMPKSLRMRPASTTCVSRLGYIVSQHAPNTQHTGAGCGAGNGGVVVAWARVALGNNQAVLIQVRSSRNPAEGAAQQNRPRHLWTCVCGGRQSPQTAALQNKQHHCILFSFLLSGCLCVADMQEDLHKPRTLKPWITPVAKNSGLASKLTLNLAGEKPAS